MRRKTSRYEKKLRVRIILQIFNYATSYRQIYRRRRTKYIRNKRGAKRHGGLKGAEDVREDKKHSQHEVLLPAWLTASHSDGCALNILHLQGHVCVKFLCKK